MNASHYWERKGRAVATRYNAAWWVSYFLKFATPLSIVAACVLLVLRRQEMVPGWFWWSFGGALFVCAVVAYGMARSRFFTLRDGLVRLDVELGLNNRLVSASEGVGEYPPIGKAEDGWRWRWWRMLLPLAGCAGLVAAAALIPIPTAEAKSATQMELPSAVAEVQAWVEKLDENKATDEKTIEELQEKIDGLKDRPQSEWYSQSAMEAAESLREQTGDSIQKLQRDLESAGAALSAAQQMGGQMPAEEMAAAQRTFDKAMQGLEFGKVPLNAKTLADLKKIDLKNVKTMSAQQFAELQKRMKEAKDTCESCTGLKMGKGDGLMAAEGKEGLGFPGGGVPQRGPGEAPLNLSVLPTELGTTKTEALPDAGMNRALPGDVVGEGQAEHEVDKAAFTGPSDAGSANLAGNGGEAVWRDELTPAEREILKGYFK